MVLSNISNFVSIQTNARLLLTATNLRGYVALEVDYSISTKVHLWTIEHRYVALVLNHVPASRLPKYVE